MVPSVDIVQPAKFGNLAKAMAGKKIQTIMKPSHLWQPGKTKASWSQLGNRDVLKIPKTRTQTKNQMQQETKPTHLYYIIYNQL